MNSPQTSPDLIRVGKELGIDINRISQKVWRLLDKTRLHVKSLIDESQNPNKRSSIIKKSSQQLGINGEKLSQQLQFVRSLPVFDDIVYSLVSTHIEKNIWIQQLSEMFGDHTVLIDSERSNTVKNILIDRVMSNIRSKKWSNDIDFIVEFLHGTTPELTRDDISRAILFSGGKIN
jgi:hypothetical protein